MKRHLVRGDNGLVMTRESRVRLPDLTVARAFMTQGGDGGATVDLSVLPTLMEELVAFTPAKILIEDTSLFAGVVGSLPPALRGWCEIVDGQRPAERLESLFLPVFEDYGLELVDWNRTSGGGMQTALRRPDSRQKDAGRHLFDIFHELYPFFFAIEHAVPAELRLSRALRLCRELRENASSSEATANLARLEQVLRSYEVTQAGGLEVRSGLAPLAQASFVELLEDYDYRERSHLAYDLGLPQRAAIAIDRLATVSKRLASNSKFEGLIQYVLTVLAAIKSVPLPEARWLLGPQREYLPPVMSFASVRQRAFNLWQRRSPPGVPHPQDDKLQAFGFRWLPTRALEQNITVQRTDLDP